ncbi:hypothetical protein F5Y03DRAFT_230258 [Xylaria venustula]|nr:hypothetical protein F5Y03DRAFT_230258 [Xylaria venustula]
MWTLVSCRFCRSRLLLVLMATRNHWISPVLLVSTCHLLPFFTTHTGTLYATFYNAGANQITTRSARSRQSAPGQGTYLPCSRLADQQLAGAWYRYLISNKVVISRRKRRLTIVFIYSLYIIDIPVHAFLPVFIYYLCTLSTISIELNYVHTIMDQYHFLPPHPHSLPRCDPPQCAAMPQCCLLFDKPRTFASNHTPQPPCLSYLIY